MKDFRRNPADQNPLNGPVVLAETVNAAEAVQEKVAHPSRAAAGPRRKPPKVRGIFERPKASGLWWIRYTDAGGREHREKAGTRGMALALLAKRRAERLEGRKLPEKLRGAAMPTLAGFAQRFMDAIELHCAAKPRTVRFYAQQLSYLLKFEALANARLSDIDESLIEAFCQHRAATVGVVSINRGLATLRRGLRLAQQWRVIDRVPRIRLLPGENRREWVLSYQDEARYLEAAPQPLRDAAVLMLDTGLRVGEAMSLTWADVRFGSGPGFVQVRDGKSRYAKRAVPLTARVRALLECRRKIAQQERVFGEFEAPTAAIRANNLYHQHKKVTKALGLPAAFVVHSLRHSFCTRLGEAGAEAFLIQRMAGHYSVTVSERYVHPTPEAMELAVARLDAANRQALPAVRTGTKSGTGALELPAASGLSC